jgi:Icc-related predicted phosphoesterase
MPTALVLSDLHGKWEKAKAAGMRHPEAEYVLIAGDITNFGSSDDVARTIQALSAGLTPRTILAVAGNCDPPSVRKYLIDHNISAEQRIVEWPMAMIAGVGGGLKRAGVTPYERTEAELKSAAGSLLAQIAAIEIGFSTGHTLPAIVLSHSPPYGSNADIRHGQHVGSFELANLIDLYHPQVWICGHIHESPCFSMEDRTLILNPGPCSCGNYALLTFETLRDGSVSIRGKLEHLY